MSRFIYTVSVCILPRVLCFISSIELSILYATKSNYNTQTIGVYKYKHITPMAQTHLYSTHFCTYMGGKLRIWSKTLKISVVIILFYKNKELSLHMHKTNRIRSRS